ncbi:MAG TPA: methyltransferase domain-containing protein [Candidatus Lokiarchaeia archaeon]|nr:methyltransferase domain-containing protein [Candidatus Lokiarchaeia archaeon]
MVIKRRSPTDFFSKHASEYAASSSHATGSDLDRLVELVRPEVSDLILDVATGTGFTAFALADRAANVVAVDITSEMLQQAKLLANDRSSSNVHFGLIEAAHLSFLNSQFDAVTTRRAAHHFEDISAVLREITRVLKPGGRLGIVDMSPPEGAGAFVNQIERIRDPTHARALTPSEWQACIGEVGLKIVVIDVLPEEVTLEGWLYPVKMGGREEGEVRQAVGELNQSERDALGLRINADYIEGWTKTRIIILAQKTLE